jgi:hypothetical protein
MKKRIVELIEECCNACLHSQIPLTSERIAAHLIANGFTLNEINLGQIIYRYDCEDMAHPLKEYVCVYKDVDHFIVENIQFADKRRLNYLSLQSEGFYFSREDAEKMVELNIKNTAKYVVENGKKLSVYSINREDFSIMVENILCEDKLYFVVFNINGDIHICNQVRVDGGE